jgi:predicted extracellular nuclease
VKAILDKDSKAQVIMAGDCNEFAFVKPLDTFVSVSKLRDIDEVTRIKPVERYSYLFDMNTQELDHVFISKSIKHAEFEHVHVNTWVSYAAQISDHDPSVARLNLCQK